MIFDNVYVFGIFLFFIIVYYGIPSTIQITQLANSIVANSKSFFLPIIHNLQYLTRMR